MTILGLDHLQLAMPRGREAEARAFYGDLLGLDEVSKPPGLAMRGGCWFGRGEVALHLGVEEDFRPARKAHPAFIVDDLAELERRLIAAGHACRSGEPIDGRTRLHTGDPFGNRIELIQAAGQV